METVDLDQFILTTAGNNWRKVAMVIAVALTDPSLDLPETDDDADFIARRIEAPIGQGALEVHGNPSNWRLSEVRQAPASPAPANNSSKPTPVRGAY